MYNTHIYAGGYERILKKSSLAQSIRRLREKGFIDFVDQGKLVFKITDLGRDALGFYNRESEWDGRLRIVIFDVPLDKGKVRKALRRKLKEWGFKMWQQSVWITKRDITEKMRNLIKQLGMDRWVAVFESDNFIVDERLYK